MVGAAIETGALFLLKCSITTVRTKPQIISPTGIVMPSISPSLFPPFFFFLIEDLAGGGLPGDAGISFVSHDLPVAHVSGFPVTLQNPKPSNVIVSR